MLYCYLVSTAYMFVCLPQTDS